MMFDIFLYMLLSIFLVVVGVIGIFLVYKETIKMLKNVTNRNDIKNSYGCNRIKIDFFCNSIISFLVGCVFIYILIVYL